MHSPNGKEPPLDNQHLQRRSDFQPLLERLIAETNAQVAHSPTWRVLTSIQAQLQAMRTWTADGRDPLPEERARISIGMLVVRELEPGMPAELAPYASALIEITDYFKRWPSDAARAEVDEDDLLSDFYEG